MSGNYVGIKIWIGAELTIRRLLPAPACPGWLRIRPPAARSPYDWLLAIGGLAYALAVAYFRWRG
jgi:hypothetical protein